MLWRNHHVLVPMNILFFFFIQLNISVFIKRSNAFKKKVNWFLFHLWSILKSLSMKMIGQLIVFFHSILNWSIAPFHMYLLLLFVCSMIYWSISEEIEKKTSMPIWIYLLFGKDCVKSHLIFCTCWRSSSIWTHFQGIWNPTVKPSARPISNMRENAKINLQKLIMLTLRRAWKVKFTWNIQKISQLYGIIINKIWIFSSFRCGFKSVFSSSFIVVENECDFC